LNKKWAIALTLFIIIAISLSILFNLIKTGQTPVNSVAVLPIENISGDPEQEYICDGMTEELINNLSRLSELKVIARQSVMKFQNSDKSIPEIGKELNVRNILMASLRKTGNRLRVTTQLIEAASGYIFWTNKYDEDLKDIFAVLDDISLDIAKDLSGKLSPEQMAEVRTTRPANSQAYQCLLKGRHFHYRYMYYKRWEDFKAAEEMYKKTIEFDPNYAESYAHLSELYNDHIHYNPGEREKYEHLVEENIDHALDLDSNSVVVQAIHTILIQDPEKKCLALRKILNRDPNHFGINLQLGIQLRNIGLERHSLPYFDKANEVNPVDQWAYAARGLSYTYIGELEKAEQDFKFALQIEPDDYWTLRFYSFLLIMFKRTAEADSLLHVFEAEYPDDNRMKLRKSWVMALKGDSTNAMKLCEELGFGRIILYALLNKRDEVIKLMQEEQQETADNIRVSSYLGYKYLPCYDNLREDERFKDILAEEKRKYEILSNRYEDILE
jgi:TolB-like protein/Tfp pilus assembly protein PilF